ncbi:dihydrolipoyl dehydrogenase [Mycoplasma iguanae]|uniref:Dihydrolipoyl dehydrogenase n=1 Tax=Mycoplasma iguanae TaxID=292461 RepID=A0ABY5R9R7_9MOLU|nr:dihydrolipoyl dehydrogenase [Mycoplasma iguanae]UVD81517.1 dihydrolipoyl dehydrogenase [Mycoplasma iguanae]
MEKFDIIFIGAGPGGYSSAAILSEAGLKVAVVEQQHLGGTCVNLGCIPTKTLLKSAKVFDLIKKANVYGIETDSPKANLKAIQEIRKNNKTKLNGAIKGALDGAGVSLFDGVGKILDANTVIVNDGTKLTTKKIVIATGARPREIEFQGKDNAQKDGVLINSNDLLMMEQLPKSIVIIGGGPISIEFSYYMATFGVEVTILEHAEKLLSRFDEECSAQIIQYLEAKGVKIYHDARIESYQNNSLEFTSNEQTHTIKAEKILVAAGRVPNIEVAEKLGLELTPGKGIKVNDKMETSIANVYAIGDVTGLSMVTTNAYKQGDILAQNLLGLKIEKYNPANYAWSIYMGLELAGVGLSSAQAVEKYGIDNVLQVTVPAQQLPRNHADSNLDLGFFKLIVKKDDGKVLGSYIFLENASLLINEIALAVTKDLTIWDLQQTGHTHPTLSEAIYYVSRNLSFKLKR